MAFVLQKQVNLAMPKRHEQTPCRWKDADLQIDTFVLPTIWPLHLTHSRLLAFHLAKWKLTHKNLGNEWTKTLSVCQDKMSKCCFQASFKNQQKLQSDLLIQCYVEFQSNPSFQRTNIWRTKIQSATSHSINHQVKKKKIYDLPRQRFRQPLPELSELSTRPSPQNMKCHLSK